MQIQRAIGATAILLAMGAIPATAGTVSYTLNFTVASAELLPTSGSFVYDTTANSFTSFLVGWDGFAFNMTSAANSPNAAGLAIGDPCITAAGAAGVFMAFTSCVAAGGGLEWDALGNTGVEGFFAFFYAGGAFAPSIFQLDTGINGEGPNPLAADGTVTATLHTGAPTPEPATIGLSALGGAFLLLLGFQRSTRNR